MFARRLAVVVGIIVSFGCYSAAQSGSVIPQGGAGHAAQASCIILKRMGPADQVTSHMYSFGLRGKQFQYVEGKLPEGFPFHGRLTDHDVRNLQGRGAEVIVLDAHYTADDLRQARDDCRGETGKSPNQADPKAAPSQASTAVGGSSPPAAPTTEVQTGLQPAAATPVAQQVAKPSTTKLSIASNPSSADIEVDGSFVGNTPSMVELETGDHVIRVGKPGYKIWERRLKANGGNVNIDAELEAETK